jgi:hypothetical protein
MQLKEQTLDYSYREIEILKPRGYNGTTRLFIIHKRGDVGDKNMFF